MVSVCPEDIFSTTYGLGARAQKLLARVSRKWTVPLPDYCTVLELSGRPEGRI